MSRAFIRRGRRAVAREVPVLVTPEGALGESAQILAWIDERHAS